MFMFRSLMIENLVCRNCFISSTNYGDMNLYKKKMCGSGYSLKKLGLAGRKLFFETYFLFLLRKHKPTFNSIK